MKYTGQNSLTKLFQLLKSKVDSLTSAIAQKPSIDDDDLYSLEKTFSANKISNLTNETLKGFDRFWIVDIDASGWTYNDENGCYEYRYEFSSTNSEKAKERNFLIDYYSPYYMTEDTETAYLDALKEYQKIYRCDVELGEIISDSEEHIKILVFKSLEKVNLGIRVSVMFLEFGDSDTTNAVFLSNRHQELNALIDDTTPSTDKVYSSSKVDNLLSGISSGDSTFFAGSYTLLNSAWESQLGTGVKKQTFDLGETYENTMFIVFCSETNTNAIDDFQIIQRVEVTQSTNTNIVFHAFVDYFHDDIKVDVIGLKTDGRENTVYLWAYDQDVIDDNAVGYDTTWSSDLINSKLEARPMLNDAIIDQYYVYSNSKVEELLSEKAEIDDTTPSTTSVYSSSKVEELLESAGGGSTPTYIEFTPTMWMQNALSGGYRCFYTFGQQDIHDKVCVIDLVIPSTATMDERDTLIKEFSKVNNAYLSYTDMEMAGGSRAKECTLYIEAKEQPSADLAFKILLMDADGGDYGLVDNSYGSDVDLRGNRCFIVNRAPASSGGTIIKQKVVSTKPSAQTGDMGYIDLSEYNIDPNNVVGVYIGEQEYLSFSGVDNNASVILFQYNGTEITGDYYTINDVIEILDRIEPISYISLVNGKNAVPFKHLLTLNQFYLHVWVEENGNAIRFDISITNTDEMSTVYFSDGYSKNASKLFSDDITVFYTDTPYKTISFTINGTSYQAEQGMTWEQWIGSEYDTTVNGYIDSDGGVCVNTGWKIYGVDSTDTIISGEEYDTMSGEIS